MKFIFFFLVMTIHSVYCAHNNLLFHDDSSVLNDQLIIATQENDLGQVSSLLAKKASPLAPHPVFGSALNAAIVRGAFDDIIMLLLDFNGSPKTPDAGKRSPIDNAWISGRNNLIPIFLSRGAQPSEENLYNAAIYGEIDLVKEYFAFGIEPKQPLLLQVALKTEKNKLSLMRLLIKQRLSFGMNFTAAKKMQIFSTFLALEDDKRSQLFTAIPEDSLRDELNSKFQQWKNPGVQDSSQPLFTATNFLALSYALQQDPELKDFVRRWPKLKYLQM